jgi:pyruvate, orthophosphate dikinase
MGFAWRDRDVTPQPLKKRFLDCIKVFTCNLNESMCRILLNYYGRRKEILQGPLRRLSRRLPYSFCRKRLELAQTKLRFAHRRFGLNAQYFAKTVVGKQDARGFPLLGIDNVFFLRGRRSLNRNRFFFFFFFFFVFVDDFVLNVNGQHPNGAFHLQGLDARAADTTDARGVAVLAEQGVKLYFHAFMPVGLHHEQQAGKRIGRKDLGRETTGVDARGSSRLRSLACYGDSALFPIEPRAEMLAFRSDAFQQGRLDRREWRRMGQRDPLIASLEHLIERARRLRAQRKGVARFFPLEDDLDFSRRRGSEAQSIHQHAAARPVAVAQYRPVGKRQRPRNCLGFFRRIRRLRAGRDGDAEQQGDGAVNGGSHAVTGRSGNKIHIRAIFLFMLRLVVLDGWFFNAITTIQESMMTVKKGTSKMAKNRAVYFFGAGKADGNAAMKNLLGGKGANLAEMCKLGIPVPAGFTVTTEVCVDYFRAGMKHPRGLKAEVAAALAKVEKAMGLKFGDPNSTLLLSCRSGARMSMPGMMETVLNIGLCSKTIPGLIAKTGNPRFVYDAYRRLIAMYADVVMEKAEGREVAEGRGIRMQLEHRMEALKQKRGCAADSDLSAEDLQQLCEEYKKLVHSVLGKDFPDDPMEQLWGGIDAVFKSWNGKRAIAYRRIEGIPDEWGTAVNVQAMVFGNMGDSSATGVAFTRNPATGENKFYGEWLVNAQGEDVVAGTRTPSPLNEATKNDQNRELVSLQKAMPKLYRELVAIRNKLEAHYRDMQDIEFTIQEGKLYMLQTRVGKRTGTAALNMAMDMLKSKLIDEKTAVQRVKPAQLDEMLHPLVDPVEEKKVKSLAKGLPAGPGGAVGQLVFTAADAVAWAKSGKTVILVREETNPEDVEGMRAAAGILTARGGMTSHAALVARGWGKCCIVGASEIAVDARAKKMTVAGRVCKEGDFVTMNGTRGLVYAGKIPMIDATENPRFQAFMKIVDKFRTMQVWANADTPEDAAIAKSFGAQGIGLFRTEHMFYGEGADVPLFLLRKMILSSTVAARGKALKELSTHVKRDMKATLEAMNGLPVTIRLLDPPLHEFVPQSPAKQAEVAKALGITVAAVRKRGAELHENNPMMGHRGVRLGVTYPEITEMQVRAIFEAAAELLQKGGKPVPEIMIPVTCDRNELTHQKAICQAVHDEVCQAKKMKAIPHMVGTMIEIPRACLLADKMAEEAEFFSFGTNDLTQMSFGFSRDDIGGFLGEYLDRNVLKNDPFQTIDQEGVGQLIEMAVAKGRSTRKNLQVGICGEQGGDPASVAFCFKMGLNYVSCSPYRVPIARLAAAQAALG